MYRRRVRVLVLVDLYSCAPLPLYKLGFPVRLSSRVPRLQVARATPAVIAGFCAGGQLWTRANSAVLYGTCITVLYHTNDWPLAAEGSDDGAKKGCFSWCFCSSCVSAGEARATKLRGGLRGGMSWHAHPPPPGWTPVQEQPDELDNILFESFVRPFREHARLLEFPELPHAEDAHGECGLRFLLAEVRAPDPLAWFAVPPQARAARPRRNHCLVGGSCFKSARKRRTLGLPSATRPVATRSWLKRWARRRPRASSTERWRVRSRRRTTTLSLVTSTPTICHPTLQQRYVLQFTMFLRCVLRCSR